MYQTINVHQFREAFIDMDRKESFSYDGLTALFEFLEEMAEDTGQDFEMDVIGLCCDFVEMDYKEILSQYDLATFDELAELDDGEQIELIVERLGEETAVVYYDDDKVLFQVF